MEVVKTSLDGVLLVKPKVFGDQRGYFLETFRVQQYAELGIRIPFVQENHSRSRRGILRGIHYQNPRPQGKLVSVIRGAVFDVAVDIRPDSPNYGKWFGTILDDKEHHQLWVPPGFGHGFCVLSEVVDFVYKCTDYYMPEYDATIRWDDPDIGIEWPIDDEPVLSNKDKNAPRLEDVAKHNLPKVLSAQEY
ncbi:MAG: dTDP-4-dehydrorhamnose 3,5-epimerase [Syntrophotalea acetylenica]|nr:dTDP-4-dehydrorhamnose 3,5-epimerase [Syntrophotalea acetylenica]